MTRQRDFLSLRRRCWYSLSSCRYPREGQRSLSTCSRSSSVNRDNKNISSGPTGTAGVCVEILQEGEEGVRGDSVDGHHPTPCLRVLPAEHGRHDIAASHQDRPVSWKERMRSMS
ncbi:hypothetical protein J4Q44_G00108000 [Coregonus suidteri]|uniref:Uncharacterized protein n=1 Tax=Coregonus suidteri TaxID=861788 RepID=A0AAN8M086_9TELE